MSSSWPVSDLRLRWADLLLRPVTEADLPLLAAHLPDDVELDPSLPADRTVALFQEHWRRQGRWSQQDWAVAFLVELGGTFVGVQVLEATDFGLLRTVDSASWLVPAARGRGTGKAMRSAVLDLAFGHLHAQSAVTSAWHDNAASLGVSRSLGYQPNGEQRHRRVDRADVMVHLRLAREAWTPVGTAVEGLAECRHLFGA